MIHQQGRRWQPRESLGRADHAVLADRLATRRVRRALLLTALIAATVGTACAGSRETGDAPATTVTGPAQQTTSSPDPDQRPTARTPTSNAPPSHGDPPTTTVYAAVKCEDIGRIVVAMPPAAGLQPASEQNGPVHVYVSYSATNLRTGARAAGGSAAPSRWAYWCDHIQFSRRPAAELSTGPTPAGARAGDTFSGQYTVTVQVDVAAPPDAAPPASQPFPARAALGSYLATRPGEESLAAFDARTGATYAYAPGARFRTASTVKAAILGTLLLRAQDAGRALSTRERDLASRMIEFSDNDATNTLWDAIGRGAGLARFTGKAGMRATVPGPDKFWIVTETTALDEVALMRALAYPNPVLTDASRGYALALLGNVTPSQRWGVSAAAGAGEQVAVKNGWVIPLGGWAVHSLGRVWGARRDLVVAVLTFGSPTQAAGIATTEAAARLAAGGLGRGG